MWIFYVILLCLKDNFTEILKSILQINDSTLIKFIYFCSFQSNNILYFFHLIFQKYCILFFIWQNMQENIQLQRYFQTLTCSFSNPIGYFCINPQCEQSSIICKQFGCKCKSLHKACETNIFTFFIQLIQKQKRKPTESQHLAFKAVISEYDTILQTVSELKNAFVEFSENYGLSTISLKFINSVIYGKTQQITGSLLNQIKKQGNIQNKDLLWVFPHEMDIKKHCKQIQQKFQQIIKQLNEYNSIQGFKVQFKSKLLTEEQKNKVINIFNIRYLDRLEFMQQGNSKQFQKQDVFKEYALVIMKCKDNDSIIGFCTKSKDYSISEQKWKQYLREQIQLKKRFVFGFLVQGLFKILYEQIQNPDDPQNKKVCQSFKIKLEDFQNCNMQFFKVHWKD